MTMVVITAEAEGVASAFNTATFPREGNGTYALSTSCPFTCPETMPVEPELPAETFETTTLTAFEAAEPGFVTVTGTTPTWDAVAVPVVASWVDETNVVLRGVLPNKTCAPSTKPL